MYRFARDLLFLASPELSHELALRGLALGARTGMTQRFVHGVYQPVHAMGLKFRNRIGLAAGLDKDARCVPGLLALGFGFVEVGTVTPRPQDGNTRPRLFRLRAERALINRMGFNNSGMHAVASRLSDVRPHLSHAAIVGVNIGKNRDTPLERANDDYLACFDHLHAVADYVAVNVSSPNTPQLRALQEEERLLALLGALTARRADLERESGRRVPIAAKLSPDLEEHELVRIARVLREVEVDGVIATNTTVARPFANGPRAAREEGGLSGPPLHPLALKTVEVLARELDGRMPIIGVGGVHDVASGRAMLAAGATLVQVYTGLIYEGPELVHRLACGLG